MLPKKVIVAVIVVVIAIASIGIYVIVSGPTEGAPKQTIIEQQGSETMLELCLKWAEDYHKVQPSTTINITRGGSGPGIQALLDRNVSIAQSSRPMSATEMATASAEGMTILEIKVAVDGITIIVNPNNHIETLTENQLRGIYNGTITNWKDLGGGNMTILPYGRNSTSGTYVYFQENVLKNENYTSKMVEYDNYNLMINDVMTHPEAIGYVGIGFADQYPGVNIVSLKANDTSPSYSPLDKDAVLNQSYVLSRYLYFYLSSEPKGPILDYIEWIIDPAKGQKDAEEMGFYALPQSVIDADRNLIGL